MDAETEKLSQEEVQKLIEETREWVKQNFPGARSDDHYLLRFIEGCKYRTEKIRSKLECDYYFRRKTPEWYADRDPEGDDIKGILASGAFIFPELWDDKGRRILISRPCFHDVKYSGNNYFKAVAMVYDEVIEKDPTVTANGIVTIVDCDGICLTHCLKKTFALKKVMNWWMNTLPMRTKEVHFIRIPYYAIYFLNLIKSFLNEKMKKRFILHGDVRDLKKSIDPTLLPKEYYGTNGSINDLADSYVKNIFAKRQWFLDHSINQEI